MSRVLYIVMPQIIQLSEVEKNEEDKEQMDI